MNKNSDPVNENDLHAYVDGFLDPDRRAEVEAWLGENPDAAAMVADWADQSEGIRGLFSDYRQDRPGDAALLSAKAGALSTPATSPRRVYWQTAAAIVLFVGGTVVGQVAPPLMVDRGAPPAPSATASLPEQAKSAFLIYASDVRHPVEVGASEQAHLASWLGKRLDYPLDVPDLSGIGFNLVGGRLVPVSGKPGALFMYEDDTGQRVTVLVGRNDQNRTTSFRFASDDGVETFYWIDGPIGYAVSGEISRERLQLIANECYRQFPS